MNNYLRFSAYGSGCDSMFCRCKDPNDYRVRQLEGVLKDIEPLAWMAVAMMPDGPMREDAAKKFQALKAVIGLAEKEGK